MPFPFILRSHHETVVKQLRAQLVGLARTIYEGRDVPEEFQLILGVTIPKGEKAASVPEPAEPKLTPIQKAEEEEGERIAGQKARLRSLLRTRPSQVGPALEQIYRSEAHYAARGANPQVGTIFATAKAEVLEKQ